MNYWHSQPIQLHRISRFPVGKRWAIQCDLRTALYYVRGPALHRRLVGAEDVHNRGIIRSNGIIAKPFRKWLVTELLPTIRRTGSYGEVAPTGQKQNSKS